ncbi:MAG: hypothetical protein HOP15_13230 [Planctomycetes bacterium]|nr:hypothetical protein [Planctomycetota bacterium]
MRLEPVPGAERLEPLGPGDWLELQRCANCSALWACGRHEPHGAKCIWTLWPGDEASWRRVLQGADGAAVLGEWHDAVLREDWLDLPPPERSDIERWRTRTRRELNPIDREGAPRFIPRSADIARHLDDTGADRREEEAEPPAPRAPTRSPWPKLVGYACAGLVYGLCVSALAVVMGGAGHGWSSGAISSVAIAFVPVLGLAWGMRERRLGRLLAGLLVIFMLSSDAALALATRREGEQYFAKVWSAAPEVLLAWFTLWIGWQAAALWILLRPSSGSSSSARAQSRWR